MNYPYDLKTFNENPTPEATKAAVMVSRLMYWLTNKSTKELWINAFGNVMGEHYFAKILALRDKNPKHICPDSGIWFELDNHGREKLMHYILKTGYKG